MRTGIYISTGILMQLGSAGFLGGGICKPKILDNHVLLSKSCLDREDLGIDFAQQANILINASEQRSGMYDGLSDITQTSGIHYTIASPRILLSPITQWRLLQLGYIYVPNYELANIYTHLYSIYGSRRDSSMYGSCRRQNYLIALGHLDRYILSPNKTLVMNTLIANDPGYCGAETNEFLFYQGVCGGSTMLFWNALTNPTLEITKRHAHNHRYTNFYGGTRGDDAAIYEMSKLLNIKNVSKNPVYFRVVRDSQDNPIILSLTKKRSESTLITKQHHSKKKSTLTRSILDIYGQEKDAQHRVSQYIDDNTDQDSGDFPYSF